MSCMGSARESTTPVKEQLVTPGDGGFRPAPGLAGIVPQCIKVVIIGAAGVGKTSVMNNLVGRPFQEILVPTIGVDFMRHYYHWPEAGIETYLQLWDTAGQERFNSLGEGFYRAANAVVGMYSLTDAETLDALTAPTGFLNDALAGLRPGATVAIVGNKHDLPEERDVGVALGPGAADGVVPSLFSLCVRAVIVDDVEWDPDTLPIECVDALEAISRKLDLALEHAREYSDNVFPLETSAKTGHNVDALFTEITERVAAFYLGHLPAGDLVQGRLPT